MSELHFLVKKKTKQKRKNNKTVIFEFCNRFLFFGEMVSAIFCGIEAAILVRFFRNRQD